MSTPSENSLIRESKLNFRASIRQSLMRTGPDGTQPLPTPRQRIHLVVKEPLTQAICGHPCPKFDPEEFTIFVPATTCPECIEAWTQLHLEFVYAPPLGTGLR